jgi:uncharacterized protein YgiB involved in biofilm formation
MITSLETVVTMRIKSFSKVILIALLGVAAAGLGGCGSGSKTAKKTEKFVFTSSDDCVQSGKFKPEECTSLIEKAIDAHVKSATAYSGLRACEKAEGEGNCERTGEDSYKPRLVAYAIIAGQQITAQPLYVSLKGKSGMTFRGADKSLFVNDKDGLVFSQSALSVAELYASSKKKKKG